ncbi:hypothetical protein D3C73_1569530 [compost metagenome]
MDAGILEHERSRNYIGLSQNADHVVAQPHNPGCARLRELSFRNAAAEIDVTFAIIVDQHRRIEQPGYIFDARC